MTSIVSTSSQRFRAIVFKRAPPTPDFTCSERALLPGEYNAQEARAALDAALRADVAGLFVGGEVLPSSAVRHLQLPPAPPLHSFAHGPEKAQASPSERFE